MLCSQVTHWAYTLINFIRYCVRNEEVYHVFVGLLLLCLKKLNCKKSVDKVWCHSISRRDPWLRSSKGSHGSYRAAPGPMYSPAMTQTCQELIIIEHLSILMKHVHALHTVILRQDSFEICAYWDLLSYQLCNMHFCLLYIAYTCIFHHTTCSMTAYVTWCAHSLIIHSYISKSLCLSCAHVLF